MVGHIPYAKGMGNLVKINRGMGKNKNKNSKANQSVTMIFIRAKTSKPLNWSMSLYQIFELVYDSINNLKWSLSLSNVFQIGL